MADLIREDDMAVYCDKGYASGGRPGVLCAAKEKAKPGRDHVLSTPGRKPLEQLKTATIVTADVDQACWSEVP